MRIHSTAALLLSLATPAVHGFAPSSCSRWRKNKSCVTLRSSSGGPDDDLLRESAEQMKSMKPEDIDRMMSEMDQMNPAQKAALKAMGMNPDLMRKSMSMMKDNPQMMESARKMMENMTPEQLMEQSKLAQEQMASMDAKDVEAAAKAMESLSPEQLDAAAESVKVMSTPSALASDEPLVIDTMYRTAELMSRPPTGGVTLQAFSTLPPIAVLSGTREEDLSEEELTECWSEGSSGAARVDRAGFERVWNEIRDYFEGDIMDEARKTAGKRRLAGASSSSSSPSSPAAEVVGAGTQPVVGASLGPEEMAAVNSRVKQMSEDDIGTMLDQMSNLTPEQEARMRAMGADPSMMSKAAKMMSSNPMMKKAATQMMKNMSPEQMARASQQAQEQMAGMSEEDKRKAMENIEKMK